MQVNAACWLQAHFFQNWFVFHDVTGRLDGPKIIQINLENHIYIKLYVLKHDSAKIPKLSIYLFCHFKRWTSSSWKSLVYILARHHATLLLSKHPFSPFLRFLSGYLSGAFKCPLLLAFQQVLFLNTLQKLLLSQREWETGKDKEDGWTKQSTIEKARHTMMVGWK